MLKHPALNVGTPGIGTVALPQFGDVIADGTIGRVSGWGAAYEGRDIETFLRTLLVPTVNIDQCRLAYGDSVTNGMFCAGVPEGNIDISDLRIENLKMSFL